MVDNAKTSFGDRLRAWWLDFTESNPAPCERCGTPQSHIAHKRSMQWHGMAHEYEPVGKYETCPTCGGRGSVPRCEA